MSEFKELSHIEKFGGSGYNVWKFQMHVALRGAELQTIVDGTEVSTAATAAEWLKRDSKAISMLCSTIDRKILEHLLNCKTSKDIWDKIALIHSRGASQTVHQLQLRYYSLKISEPGGLAVFMGEIELINSQLKDLGDPGFGDSMNMAMLLGSLPPSYDPFISAWKSVAAASQTLDYLKQRLLDEECQIRKRSTELVGLETHAFFCEQAPNQAMLQN